jgi:hypothetical protein
VGKKIKSPTCYIDSFIQATEQNWHKFFLGTNEVLADSIIDILNPQPRSLLLSPTSGSTISLPPAVVENSHQQTNISAVETDIYSCGDEEYIPF